MCRCLLVAPVEHVAAMRPMSAPRNIRNSIGISKESQLISGYSLQSTSNHLKEENEAE